MKKFVIDANKKCKLSEFVYHNFPQISYNTLQKMLRKKDVLVNRERINKDIMLEKGDFLELYCPESAVKYFDVVYEDDNIIVVNKSFGIIVSEKDKTKPNELSLQELVEKQIKHKVLAIHRIDMNTSGLVMFCKTQKIFNELKESMKNHEVSKVYYAEVVGSFTLPNKEYIAYLEKNLKTHSVYVSENKKSERGMQIKTHIELIEQKEKSAIVKVIISNGKTHQIRAHLSYLGFPLVGDNKYGNKNTNKKFGTRKQKLLACELKFNIKNPKLNYLNKIKIKLKNTEINNFFNK